MRKIPFISFLFFTALLLLAGCQSDKKSESGSVPINTENNVTVSLVALTPTETAFQPTSTEPASTDNSQATDSVEATQPTQQLIVTAKATEPPTETLQEPTPTVPNTPESTSESASVVSDSATAAQCIDEAAFYADVTIPDDTLMQSGDTFTKIWRVRNTGTCTWYKGYSLVFASGDIMNGPLSNPMQQVEPGEITEISVDLVAPARGGQHVGNWQFENSQGTRFGVGSGGHDYIWVQIVVDWQQPDTSQNSSQRASNAAGTTASSSQLSCKATRDPSYEIQVLALINDARTAAGLLALAPSNPLNQAALEHSQDMACGDFIDHTGSDGSTWYDRAKSNGYANYTSARENIYVGNPDFGGTPDGAFSWWMNSLVHRDNILNSNVSEIGIGYVYDSASTYGGYYTAVFARP